MYGAILGDMIGAPYEFDRSPKKKDFPLFSDRSHFTDDTVMTIAVAESLLDNYRQGDDAFRQALVDSMQKWGRKYPHAGYGGRFSRWLGAKNPKPYGSYGNGSAMRVSAVGWLYETLSETQRIAHMTAEVTHNHPEGIKGAEATASAIFLARTGHSKDEIRDYITKEYGYDLSRTCDQIRPTYHHVESCQQTVPEAITAFLEGDSFEDVIRTAVSLGGDCDTLTCIAGAIAEAFYGVSVAFEAECKARLPEDMLYVLGRFDIAREHGGSGFPEDCLSGNRTIERAIARFHEKSSWENLIALLESIRRRMQEDGHFLIPVIPPQPALEMLDINKLRVGDTVTSEEELSFRLHHVQTKDGQLWLAAFTSEEELEKGELTSVISNFIDSMIRGCADMSEAGIIINPWGQSFLLTKELMQLILDADRQSS